MEPEILLEELKSILEKLGIELDEKNLDDEELTINSGYCEVTSQTDGKKTRKLIIDNRFPASDRVSVILGYLKTANLDEVYITPALRDIIESGRE